MRITLLTYLSIKWLPRMKTVFGNAWGKFLLLRLSGRTRVLSSPQSTTSGMMTQLKHDVELDADDHKVLFAKMCGIVHILKIFTGRPSQKLEWEKGSQQCLLWSTVPRSARWNIMKAVLNDTFNTSKVDLDENQLNAILTFFITDWFHCGWRVQVDAQRLFTAFPGWFLNFFLKVFWNWI